MAMTLQEAIDFAIAPPVPTPNGIEVLVTISMHDEDGTVLVGDADGLSDMFRPDLPLLNFGMATLAAPGATTATAGGSRFRKGPAPGFSTRRLGPAQGADAPMVVETGTHSETSIPIDFSVRKDPGFPYLSFLGRWGPAFRLRSRRSRHQAVRRPVESSSTRSKRAGRCCAPSAPIPAWYLLGAEDKTIPPALHRFVAERANATIVEVTASHVSFVSQPDAATQLILQAVNATMPSAIRT